MDKVEKFREENLALTLFMNDEEVLKEIYKRRNPNKKIIKEKEIVDYIIGPEIKIGDKVKFTKKALNAIERNEMWVVEWQKELENKEKIYIVEDIYNKNDFLFIKLNDIEPIWINDYYNGFCLFDSKIPLLEKIEKKSIKKFKFKIGDRVKFTKEILKYVKNNEDEFFEEWDEQIKNPNKIYTILDIYKQGTIWVCKFGNKLTDIINIEEGSFKFRNRSIDIFQKMNKFLVGDKVKLKKSFLKVLPKNSPFRKKINDIMIIKTINTFNKVVLKYYPQFSVPIKYLEIVNGE